MVRTRSFPNFWQALLLIGFYWVMMSAPIQLAERLGIVSHPYRAIATVLIGSPLAALVVLWTGYRLTRAPLSAVFPIQGFPSVSAVAAVASTIGIWILIDAAGGTGSTIPIDPRNGRWALLRLVVPVIYAPLAEELLHRGLILQGFLSRYGEDTAILLSAVLFAMLHAPLGPANAVSALCFGIVLGYIFVEARSLLPCLLIHATSNAMFSVSPRVNVALWGWLGFPHPFWVDGPWYAALGAILAGSGIAMLIRTRLISKRTAVTHRQKGMALTGEAEQEGGETGAHRFEEADQEYAAALDLAPDDQLALINWGVALTRHAHAQSGDAQDRLFEQAYDKYSRAVAITASAQALANWGGALALQAQAKMRGEPDRLWALSRAKFEEALRIDPRSHSALRMWAMALRDEAETKTGDERNRLIAEALAKFEASAAIDGDDQVTFRHWGELLLKQAAQKQGEDARLLWSEALRTYERWIEIAPHNPRLRLTCATVALRLGELGGGNHALELLNRAQSHCAATLEIEPEDVAAWDTWGATFMVQAEKAGAPAARDLRAQAKSKYLQAESISSGSAAYNLACVCALQDEETSCQEWLLKVEHHDSKVRERLFTDPDLKSVRERPWFQEILAIGAGANRSA